MHTSSPSIQSHVTYDSHVFPVNVKLFAWPASKPFPGQPWWELRPNKTAPLLLNCLTSAALIGLVRWVGSNNCRWSGCLLKRSPYLANQYCCLLLLQCILQSNKGFWSHGTSFFLLIICSLIGATTFDSYVSSHSLGTTINNLLFAMESDQIACYKRQNLVHNSPPLGIRPSEVPPVCGEFLVVWISLVSLEHLVNTTISSDFGWNSNLNDRSKAAFDCLAIHTSYSLSL